MVRRWKMTIRLQISLLGGFQLRNGDIPVPGFDPPRLQALIAWLVLHAGVPQPRQQVAFQFWPDSTEQQARTNLRQVLHLLRQRLPNSTDFIVDAERSLTWRADADYSLDIRQFEQLARDAQTLNAMMTAADLYRGDLLPQLYDDWLVPERERLRAVFAQLLERAIRRAEAERDSERGRAAAQRLIAHDPLQERAYRALMRLSAGRGDRAGVLRAYRACVETWDRELGIPPSPETTALYEQLRAAQREAVERPRTANRPVLPIPATPLIGRVEGLAEIATLLQHSESRLVTVTGTGGVGKTRLAVQVAVDLAPELADDVWFVDLSAVRDPAGVVPALAVTLGVRAPDSAAARDALIRFVRHRHALLVLDNFEHLLAAAPVVAELMATAPELRILVTSRAPLRVRGEHEYPVLPLSVPDRDAPPASAVDVATSDAMQLFVARARAVNPRFSVDDASAGIVAEICRQVDGLPLAIELAAARLRSLSLTEMLARLQHSLSLLTGGARDLPARQHTLRATIDWSYLLLDPVEQRLFTRLAIFVGGATLDAIEEVCSDADGTGIASEVVIDVLDSLVRQSMVQPNRLAVTDMASEPRFRMLETLHSFALERLQASGEADALARRHAEYFLDLAERTQVTTKGSPQQADGVRRLTREHDNLRAALRWGLEHDREAALRGSSALAWFWNLRGHYREGRDWLEHALRNAGDVSPTLLTHALLGLADLELAQGDYDAARVHSEQGLTHLGDSSDAETLALALLKLGLISWMRGEHDRARDEYFRCLAVSHATGDQIAIAKVLNNIGALEHSLHRNAEARPYYEESLALLRAVQYPDVAHLLNNLGVLAHDRGDHETARQYYDECLALREQHGNVGGVANSLRRLAVLAHDQAQPDEAIDYLRQSLRLHWQLGSKRDVASDLGFMAEWRAASGDALGSAYLFGVVNAMEEALGLDAAVRVESESARVIDSLRRVLGGDAYEAEWTRGRLADVEHVVNVMC
jgi:predicted ATPase/DNA-binding SARP family transcriptional activator/Tfp pilus assembly protein PilF